MHDDRPINSREQDRLGFRETAVHLATAIIAEAAKDGFVFGIEGRWGSGKSSLINLTIEALRQHGANAPEVIEFSPWLVGNRDDLIRNLLNELAAAAIQIDPIDNSEGVVGASWWRRFVERIRGNEYLQLRRKEKIKNLLAGELAAFGKLASGLASIATASTAMGFIYGSIVGTVLKFTGSAAKGFLTTSILKRKNENTKALRLLSRRIVVFVDDLDRLEPRDVSEVLRLIRAVADFPNVIYVLSYDPEVVGKSLQEVVQVDDGAAFLAKIVQVSFRVPRPEAFDLRRWFQREVYALFDKELRDDHPLRQRIAESIDSYGQRYFHTPRDVVRTLNALVLHGIPVRDRIDVSDMVWLQIIRIGKPELYDWVEQYMTEVSAIYGGGRPTEAEVRDLSQRLNALIPTEGSERHLALMDLAQLLPGIESGISLGKQDDELRIFKNLGGESLNRFIVSRRLGSPEHSRFYFAFTKPAGALDVERVRTFIRLAEQSPDEALAMFSELAAQPRPQGGVMAEVLVDRVVAAIDSVPGPAISGIFGAFASELDKVAAANLDWEFGESSIWTAADRAVQRLLTRVPPSDRAKCLEVLFRGPSLGWATGILRDEIFSHGRSGDQAKPENERLLTPAEFENVLNTMLKRYSETPPNELMRVPNFMSLLYAWKQGSSTDDAKRWVTTQVETDAGLLNFLSRAHSWVISSAQGVYYPLKKRDLEHFLDYEDVVCRVRAISSDSKASETERQSAKKLLVAIEQDPDR